jgi:hypothetical protein
VKVVALAALAALAAALVGCGTEPRRLDTAPVPSAGISVARALAAETHEPLLVKGFLVVVDEQPRLCSALAESYPPQCGAPSLAVEGLPTGDRDGLKEARGVAWSEREVALLGAVEDGVLRVSATPR